MLSVPKQKEVLLNASYAEIKVNEPHLKDILEKSKVRYFNKSASIIFTNQSNNFLYKLGLWIWHWYVKKTYSFQEKANSS